MRGFYLYYLFSIITRNPLLAAVLLLIVYAVIDKWYFGFLPDFSNIFKRNIQIRNYLKDLHLNPQDAAAASSLGALYFEIGKYGEALKYLEHPRLKNENSANYYSYLGMTFVKLKRFDEGEMYIKKALSIDPRAGHGLPYIYLIENELNKDTPDKNVLKDLEEKVERFASTEVFYKLGLIYKKSGDREKGKEFFSKALNEYSYCPKGIKRLHRKWAILARLQICI